MEVAEAGAGAEAGTDMEVVERGDVLLPAHCP